MHSHSHHSHHSHSTYETHSHGSRRDFFHQIAGAALTGASLLEIGFLRAAFARAQARTANTQLFDIQKAADGVFFARARPQAITNCNASIFVNSEDVLVVDAHSKPSAAASLIAQIKREVTTKPVRYLVNTHFHWDHSQGDPAYRAAGGKVEIIASEATKQLLAQNARNRLKENLDGVPQIIDGLKSRMSKSRSASERAFLQEQIQLAEAYQIEMRNFTPQVPDITFAQSHVIKDRAHDLHIEFHGRAHTAGDVVVFCPQQRAVATGDAVIGFLPNINDGYPRDWPKTITSISGLTADKILPGHGPLQSSQQRMTQFRNYIEELTGIVEAAKKAGKPLEEGQKSITVTSLKTLQSNGFANYVSDNLNRLTVYVGSSTPLEDRLTANISAVYNNLDRA